METQNGQTAAFLAMGVAKTTRSGVGRRRQRKGWIGRIGAAALSLLALTPLALYLGS
jgi:hypothetical protein